MDQQQKTFWTKIAVITGLLTALTAFLTILHQVGWIGNKDTHTAPAAVSAPAQQQGVYQQNVAGQQPQPNPQSNPKSNPQQNPAQYGQRQGSFCCGIDGVKYCNTPQPTAVGEICSCYNPYADTEQLGIVCE